MKIVLAPNAFKGSMSASAAAQAMREGVLKALPSATGTSTTVAEGNALSTPSRMACAAALALMLPLKALGARTIFIATSRNHAMLQSRSHAGEFLLSALNRPPRVPAVAARPAVAVPSLQ